MLLSCHFWFEFVTGIVSFVAVAILEIEFEILETINQVLDEHEMENFLLILHSSLLEPEEKKTFLYRSTISTYPVQFSLFSFSKIKCGLRFGTIPLKRALLESGREREKERKVDKQRDRQKCRVNNSAYPRMNEDFNFETSTD